jgi:DNA polymerase-1
MRDYIPPQGTTIVRTKE